MLDRCHGSIEQTRSHGLLLQQGLVRLRRVLRLSRMHGRVLEVEFNPHEIAKMGTALQRTECFQVFQSEEHQAVSGRLEVHPVQFCRSFRPDVRRRTQSSKLSRECNFEGRHVCARRRTRSEDTCIILEVELFHGVLVALEIKTFTSPS